MTIDRNGRSHHAAGAPASIGGQYAQQPAPGAASELGVPSPVQAALEAARTDHRLTEERLRTAAAAAIVEHMEAAGIDTIAISIENVRGMPEPVIAADDAETDAFLQAIGYDTVVTLSEDDATTEHLIGLELDTLRDIAARPASGITYDERFAEQQRAGRRYATESIAELRDELRGAIPGAHAIVLAGNQRDDWGDFTYDLLSIRDADGNRLGNVSNEFGEQPHFVDGIDEELIAHRLEDLARVDAVTGNGSGRQELLLDEPRPFG